MSQPNPLVVDFTVDTLDNVLPFDAESLDQNAPFHVHSEIRTLIYTGTFIYIQNSASDHWVIAHNMRKRPSVSIVDTAGTVVVGDVVYIDDNNVELYFSAPFSGSAYLN